MLYLQNKQFNIRCSQRTIDMMNSLAVELDISNSALVRLLIKDAYDEFFNTTNV